MSIIGIAQSARPQYKTFWCLFLTLFRCNDLCDDIRMSRFVSLHSRSMLFFTIKHCQFFTLTKCHGTGVTVVGKCMRMETFFCVCDLIPHFFLLSLSLSLPFLLPAFSCPFRMLGHLSRAWLILTGLHCKGTTVNRIFLVRKYYHFFITSEAFRTLSLLARELVFILLFPRILPY